jgi:hypothetical protein
VNSSISGTSIIFVYAHVLPLSIHHFIPASSSGPVIIDQ